jgi:NitT/TauT family transport system substrate-binding protein
MHTLSAMTRLVGIAIFLLLLIPGCKREEGPDSTGSSSRESQSVTLCHGSVTDLLPRIALEQGYFKQEGLSVTIREMSDGKLAFDGMLKGDCNFAVTGAPPIVSIAPSITNFTILATVMSDDDSARIVARRDRGITKPVDLKGKRIGVKKGIIGHFFLDLFMMKHGLAPKDVTVVFMDTEQFIPALEKGTIDGFSMTEKMVSAAAKKLGKNAVVFSEPGLNVVHGILTTRSDQPNNLRATPGLLKALLRARQYAHEQPAAAKALIARSLNIPNSEIEAIWSRTTVELSLPNTLFIALEDQFNWQKQRGFIPSTAQPPNYLNIVSPQYLTALDPNLVTVIKR